VTMVLDADGRGAGVRPAIELGHVVGEIRGGTVATEPGDFINARSERYWDLRERFERGDIDIDPNDDQLAKSPAQALVASYTRRSTSDRASFRW
jgi:hypothetical protein